MIIGAYFIQIKKLMNNLLQLFKKSNFKDAGLRGTKEGKLYIDKEVFYNRPEVRKAIQEVKDSKIITKMIEKHR